MKINLLTALKPKSPIIFGGLALVFLGVTIANAIKDTKKMSSLESTLPEDDKVETVKIVGKCYASTIIAGLATATCIGASVISGQYLIAAATSACSVAQTSVRAIQEAAKESLSDDNYRLVMKKATEKEALLNSPTENRIISTGSGETLCKNAIEGGYFRANPQAVVHAFNLLNYRLQREMVNTLNDLYDELNLPHTQLGDELEWTVDDGPIEFVPDYTGSELLEPILIMTCYPLPHSKRR